MGKSRIAHICNDYLPLTATFIYSFLKNMRMYEPFVLANTLSNVHLFPLKQIISIAHPPLMKRAFNRTVRLIGSLPSTQYRHYAEILTREAPAIVHAHFGETGFYSLELRRRLQLPLMTSFYGSDLSRRPRSWYWRKAYKQLFVEGDFFLTFSKKMRSMLVDLGCSPEKVVSCPAGVETTAIPFQPRIPEAAGEFRFLLCNRFVEKKGTEYAVRAFAMLQARVPQCRLTIIGDGPLGEDLHDLVSKLNLTPCVDFLGMQPYPRVLHEMLKAHVFISPSVLARDGDDEGGINYVVVEAAATGIPLVVTEHASSEVVFDGLSGLIVKERDESDLFEKLLFLVRNPSCWGHLGGEARRLVEGQFLASTQAQKLEEIYTEVISRVRGRADAGRGGG